MKKYAKLITINSIQFPPKNKGSIINYDLNEELLIADGYKELVEAQKDVGKSYNITYTETATKIIENAVEIPQPDPAEQREEQFNKDFFNTSLGYIRRKVTMKDGSQKDFLSDLLPSIIEGLRLGITPTIITYEEPDFTQEITDWTVYQVKKGATSQFVQDCLLQVSDDFGAV